MSEGRTAHTGVLAPNSRLLWPMGVSSLLAFRFILLEAESRSGPRRAGSGPPTRTLHAPPKPAASAGNAAEMHGGRFKLTLAV